MTAAAIVGLLAVSLLLLEYVLPRTILPRAWQRKIIHVGMCLLVLALTVVASYQVFVPVGLVFTGLMLLLRKYRPLVSLADRAEESLGEIFLPLGIALAALFAPSLPDFQLAVLVLGLADTAAYVVGRHVASPRLVLHKTLAGSTAYCLTATCLLLASRPPLTALGFGLALTVVELLSTKGSDNLTAPVATLFLLSVA